MPISPPQMLGYGVEFWFNAIGSVTAFILFGVKLWEIFWRDRLRLDTTYCFNGEPSVPDEVTIVNLSPIPVNVANWRLYWKPRFWRSDLTVIDVTPDEPERLRIPSHDEVTVYFGGMDKLQWGYKVSQGRRLVLELSVFGRTRKKKLIVAKDT